MPVNPPGLPQDTASGTRQNATGYEHWTAHNDTAAALDALAALANQNETDIAAHAHTGADGSVVVAHSDTSGKTANDHHNQAHAIDGADHTGTLSDGQIPSTIARDSEVTAAIAAHGPEIVTRYKTGSDELQTVNNSTTLVNDNRLSFPFGANETWAFHLIVRHFSETAADIKFAFSAPGVEGVWAFSSAPGNIPVTDFNAPGTLTIDTFGVSRITELFGSLNASSAGTLQFQWAQNTADLSDTFVQVGSYLIATRLA